MYQSHKLIPSQTPQNAVCVKQIFQLVRHGFQYLVACRMAEAVIDFLKIVQIQNDKTACHFGMAGEIHIGQHLFPHLEKQASSRNAGETVQSGFIVQTVIIFLVQGYNQQDQKDQGNNAQEKLDLQMNQVVGGFLRQMDAVPAHYLSDAVGEIDGHASDGKDQQRNEAGHPFFMLHDQGMKMVHGFDPMFQVPGLVGLLKQVAQNGQYIHNYCEKKKIPAADVIQRAGGVPAAFRKEQPHAGINQERMDHPAHGGNGQNSRHRMAALFCALVQKPGYKSEKGSGAYAQDKAGQGLPAHEGRKDGISRAHIESGSLPHGGKAEHGAYRGGLSGAH